MLLGAVGAKGTEAFLVVRTEGNLAFGVNVQVKTFFAVGAVAVPNKEITFRHFTPRWGKSV